MKSVAETNALPEIPQGMAVVTKNMEISSMGQIPEISSMERILVFWVGWLESPGIVNCPRELRVEQITLKTCRLP